MENGSYLIPDPVALDGDSNRSNRLVLTFRIYLGIQGMGSTGPDRKPTKDLKGTATLMISMFY